MPSNGYAAKCALCGLLVPAGAGRIVRSESRWVIKHHACAIGAKAQRTEPTIMELLDVKGTTCGMTLDGKLPPGGVFIEGVYHYPPPRQAPLAKQRKAIDEDLLQ